MSVLIKDAFRILSESYVKISELAIESLDLKGSPRQPDKIDQLIDTSMLYGLVTDLVILNTGGTAIIGTKNQSIDVINTLLLKLKKSAGIYTLPVFPTPLSTFQFNFGNNDGNFDITAGQLGDLIVHNGTAFTNFNMGPSGYVLVSTPTGLQWQSVVGNGIPSGGSIGQVLNKNSNIPYDVIWDTLDPTDIGVSSSAIELNKLDGALWSTAESNTLVGINTGVSIQDQLNGKIDESLLNGRFWVGDASNLPVAVTPAGDVTFNNLGFFSYTPLSIENADISTTAAIGRNKLASGSSNRLVINNNSGVMVDAGSIGADFVLVSNSDGIPIASGVTTSSFGFYDISSSLQASLDERLVVNLTGVAQGDVLFYNGTDWINLAVGTSGQVMTTDGSSLLWGSATANGIPVAGTTNQILRKIDNTNYNTEWHTPVLADLTDVFTTFTELNLLSGLTTTAAFINLVEGGDSNFQNQLDLKLGLGLNDHAIWIGGAGNTAQQVGPGVESSVLTIVAGHPTWQTPPSPGTVSGPLSSTDNAITRWNGTSGNSIQNSTIIIDDTGNVVFPTATAIRTSTSAANTLLLQAYDVDGAAYVTFGTLTANNTPTFDLNSTTTIGNAYMYRVGGTDIALSDGGTGASLSDPGVNAVMVWDDTLNAVRFSLLSGLTYNSGTNTLTASGGGGGISGPVSSTDNAIVRWDGAGGSAVQNSGIIIDDSNNLSGIANITVTTGSALRTSTSNTNTLLLQAYDVDGAVYTTFATLTAGNTPTMDLASSVTIGGSFIYRAGGTDVSLSDGGTGSSLTDPEADRILFWDDSASAVDWLTIGTGLTLTMTTLTADQEYIQDSVGNIFVDSTTIDFTYDDAVPTITGSVIDGSISDAKIRTSAALSVMGRSGNTAGNIADIVAASDHNLLRRSGTSIGFGSIDLSQSGAVGSSILGVANGGSGGTVGSWLVSGSTNITTPTIVGNPNFNGNVTLTQPVSTSGNPVGLTWTGATHTNLTASAEIIDVNFNGNRVVQRATGSVATQRTNLFQAPTYSFIGASIITNAATVAISGPPIAGTNATINNSYALWIQSGFLRCDTGLIGNGTTFTIGTGDGNTANIQTNGTIRTIYGVNGQQTHSVGSLSGAFITYTQGANTTAAGNAIGILFTAGAHTQQAASTEIVDINYNLGRIITHQTGAITTQRSFRIQAPTHAFALASTITTAATLAVTGAPIAGTNATITNSYSIWAESGIAYLQGGVRLTNTSTLGYVWTATDTLGNGSWQAVGGGGSGDVAGPASATDNAIVRFDTTTGKLIQNSAASIDDSGNITLGNVSTSGDRSIITQSSSTDASLSISAKGSSSIFLNSNSGSILINEYSIISGTASSLFPFIIRGTDRGSFSGNGSDLLIRSGNGGTSGNNNGGHVFLDVGVKGNSGLDGNLALFTTSVANWQAMQKGIFVANAIAVPTGNPASGGFLYAEAGALKWRGSSGTITTIAAA